MQYTSSLGARFFNSYLICLSIKYTQIIERGTAQIKAQIMATCILVMSKFLCVWGSGVQPQKSFIIYYLY